MTNVRAEKYDNRDSQDIRQHVKRLSKGLYGDTRSSTSLSEKLNSLSSLGPQVMQVLAVELWTGLVSVR